MSDQFNSINIKGTATQTEAATAPEHLIRKGEAEALLNSLFKGAWDDEVTYAAGQSVNDDGAFYIANTENLDTKPADNPTEWRLAATKGASAYVYVGYATASDGTGYATSPSGKTYIAVKTTTTPIVSPGAGDFAGLWVSFVGPAFSGTTDALTEGSTNKYYTDTRVRACVLTGFAASAATIAATDTVLQAFNKTEGRLVAIEARTTANWTESGNLYYTDARARAAISVNGVPLTYSAGVIGINAASANTASYVVQRDASGDFAARKVTLMTSTATDILTFGGAATMGYNGNVVFNKKLATTGIVFGDMALEETAGTLGLTNIFEATLAGIQFYTETVSFQGLTGVLRQDGGLVVGGTTTDDLPEGANLYFTEARATTAAADLLDTLMGENDGIATLDSSGKVPTAQLPAAVIGGMSYQGTWNANTNSPSLASGTGTKGYYYKVATAGTTTIDTIASWAVGDWIVFNGTTWDKIDNTDAVTSVNTQTGAVVLNTSHVSESGNLYYTDTRVRAAVLTGFSATTGAISATDTVLSGFNKCEGRLAAVEAWTTTNLAEGTNLYYTDTRVRAAVLTGFSATTGTISASDTVLSAFNKTQGRLAAVEGLVRHKNTGSVTAPADGGETSLLSDVLSVSANTLVALTQIEFELWGTGASAPAGLFRIKLGATVLTINWTVGDRWHLKGLLTVRSIGATGEIQGDASIVGSDGSTQSATANTTRDTTGGLALDVTCSASADGDIVCTQSRIKFL